jgi:hypothetical protein
MLKIRAAQQAALDRAASEEFERRVVVHVAKMWKPDREEQLIRATIAEAIERARQHGFNSERELVAYVDLTFAFGSAFHAEAWAAAILTDRSLSSAAKAELLYRRGMEQKAKPHA